MIHSFVNQDNSTIWMEKKCIGLENQENLQHIIF